MVDFYILQWMFYHAKSSRNSLKTQNQIELSINKSASGIWPDGLSSVLSDLKRILDDDGRSHISQVGLNINVY
jgi:hypothetical protein